MSQSVLSVEQTLRQRPLSLLKRLGRVLERDGILNGSVYLFWMVFYCCFFFFKYRVRRFF